MKEVIDTPIIKEEEVRELSFTEVISAVEITENGDYLFPFLEPLAEALEADYLQSGYSKGMSIEDRETYQKMKEIRSAMNKKFDKFESQRKEAKRNDNKKHDDFLGQSKDTVQRVHTDYVNDLNASIKKFEKKLIEDTTNFAISYWEELLPTLKNEDKFIRIQEALGGVEETLDTFLEVTGKIGINTTENQVIKMFEEAIEFWDRDLDTIDITQDPERVLEAYVKLIEPGAKPTVAEAVAIVKEEDALVERLAAEKLAKEREAMAQEVQQEQQAKEPEEVKEETPTMEEPVKTEEADPIKHVRVEFKGSKEKINWLLRIAHENGIKVLKGEEVEQSLFY